MNFLDFVKNWLLPGSLALFFTGLLLGLALLFIPRAARAGKYVLALLICGYFAMSLPAGAWLLGRVVSAGYSSQVDASALAGVQAIVVLDADMNRYGSGQIEIVTPTRPAALRAVEAIRLYRAIGPVWVVVSGGSYLRIGTAPEGEAIRGALLAGGVPADRLVLDSNSQNTREHPLHVMPILREKGVTRIALVTSALHMRRALRAFSGAGMQIVAAPAPLEVPRTGDWRPRVTMLDRSLEAWYEVFALLRDYLR